MLESISPTLSGLTEHVERCTLDCWTIKGESSCYLGGVGADGMAGNLEPSSKGEVKTGKSI